MRFFLEICANLLACILSVASIVVIHRTHRFTRSNIKIYRPCYQTKGPRKSFIRRLTTMATREVYLATYRYSTAQRRHFAIFVPSVASHEVGTLINVVGAPMAGYQLEFRRNNRPMDNRELEELALLGHVPAAHIVDSTDFGIIVESTARDNLERVATQVPPPPMSQNFLPLSTVSVQSFLPHY